MEQRFIIKEGNSRLLLFFAGWGMDETPFTGYRPAGHDFMVCYDYSDATFDHDLINNYDGIDVVGWSMGVWMAASALTGATAPIGTTIAVNGTIYPVDATRGIAPEIFHGTLDGLSEATLMKFRRRMCGGGAGYKEFMQCEPQRSLESLRTELKMIGDLYTMSGAVEFRWEKAIVGSSDAIFPTANQLNAWGEAGVEVEQVDAPHYNEALFRNILETIWTND